ncbi:leucine-rich repeat domain-containing protein [Spirosoma sp. BT702]|uniref:Leucine-rich repeat domain-containing protein n=1 Tax=Spirosoma profusum TaxID=2771354 RepID=A0A927ATS6_9BACT|nr:leucine-rich repeat domain-containing protein [Spirosoma profusum]MBD2704295.1 leucine-rich repeat domain-containing protein [Spirosoma profusum]
MPRKRKQILQLLEQTNAQHLPVLDFSYVSAGEFLDQICQMSWLTKLNLSHGHLSHVPHAIRNLTLLTHLDLSENQLSTLPDSFTQLKSLTYLNLHFAGYNFSATPELISWLKGIEEVVWPDTLPLFEEPPKRVDWVGSHPNRWLEILRQSLQRYSDAFNMEDRGYDGTSVRTKADSAIQQVFDQVPELQQILTQFYDDFKEHRFYWTSCQSESLLDTNPFQLPTKTDEEWLLNSPTDHLPLRLLSGIQDGRRYVYCINIRTRQKSLIFSSPFENSLIYNNLSSNQTDCSVQLFQAGGQRLFLRATFYERGTLSRSEWYSSANGGTVWKEQAELTYDWLQSNCELWPQLDFF